MIKIIFILLLSFISCCTPTTFAVTPKTKIYLKYSTVEYLGTTNIDFQLSDDKGVNYNGNDAISVTIEQSNTQKILIIPPNESTIRLNTDMLSPCKVISATTTNPNITIIIL